MPENTLYWYGNTCDWLTGGWTTGYSYNGTSGGSLTFNTQNILLDINSGSWLISGISNSIDVTDYSTISGIAYKNNTDIITNFGGDISGDSGNNYICLGVQYANSSHWDSVMFVGTSKNMTASDFIWSRDLDSDLNSYHSVPAYVYALWYE